VSLQILTPHTRNVLLLATLLVAPLTASCGAATRAEETGTGSRDIKDAVLIENGEDGDATLLVDEEAGIVGYWYTYDDRQECVHPDFGDQMTVNCGGQACAAAGDATQTQPPTAPYGTGLFMMAKYADANTEAPALEGEQKKNQYGIHLTGGGETYFGAGVGVALNNPGTLQPYDLSAQGFLGLRFAAKSGNGMPLKLRVKIKDAYSEPAGGKCIVRKNVCDATTCQCCDEEGTTCDDGLTQGCHDDPMAPAELTAVVDGSWKVYEIPFEAFVRENWGKHKDGMAPPGSALEPTVAYQLQFQVQTDATPANNPLEAFDLWLDNIGFVTKLTPTPTGTLAP
jgi:hypothetical protein